MEKLTVQELIDMLSEYDPQAEVMVQHQAGDYWRTPLASNVTDVDLVEVNYSSYHRQDKVVDDEDFGEEGNREVVILTINQSY